MADSFFQDRSTFRPDNFIYGAWQDSDLVGSAGGYVEPDTKRSHIAHVVGVWVDPECRRQGIARALTIHVIDQLKSLPQLSIIQIAATATNKGAIDLYQSLGFVQFGLEPQALQHDGQTYDEVQMAIAL